MDPFLDYCLGGPINSGHEWVVEENNNIIMLFHMAQFIREQLLRSKAYDDCLELNTINRES